MHEFSFFSLIKLEVKKLEYNYIIRGGILCFIH